MTHEINIPFAGFYESMWSDLLDRETESFVEYEPEREQENGIPEPLRLELSDYSDAVFYTMDCTASYRDIAADYTLSFNDLVAETIGHDIGLSFADMTSPRFYNFETDRIFCNLSRDAIAALWRYSKSLDNHDTLRRIIRERFTSRSGFISHYQNQIEDWPIRLSDWDCNQLGTLLLVAVEQFESDWEWSIYESLLGSACQYFDVCMDWDKYDAQINEKRVELWDQYRETETPENVAIVWANTPDELRDVLSAPDDPMITPRCAHTLDMFQGESV